MVMSKSFKIDVSNKAFMAIHLAKSIAKLSLCGNDYFLYEKGEKCFLGLGVNARISGDTSGLVKYATLFDEQQFSGKPIAELIKQAIACANQDDWRIYGLVYFDYSRLVHSLNVDSDSHSKTIDFVLPKVDIEISKTEIAVKVATNSGVEPAKIEQALHALLEDSAISAMDNFAKQGVIRKFNILEDDHYQRHVEDAVQRISNSDFLKVILSRRVHIPFDVDLLASFALARSNNTPARSFIYNLEQSAVAGLSPETVVEVSNDGLVSTQPLAGTRALGENLEQEAMLKADLLSDSKEIAEHAMSVKLAVEEMESVCRPETVFVSEFMDVKRRGSVQHLASRVVGKLADDRCSWDALSALFPAITASGICKQKSIQYIYDTEPDNRGLYSGAALLADSSGMLDAALIIRSLFKENGKYWLQAGAGIVKESRSEREFEETCEKLSSLSNYIVEAV